MLEMKFFFSLVFIFTFSVSAVDQEKNPAPQSDTKFVIGIAQVAAGAALIASGGALMAVGVDIGGPLMMTGGGLMALGGGLQVCAEAFKEKE